MEEDIPLVSIAISAEIYLKRRDDPLWTEIEVSIPAQVIDEVGVEGLMEMCLEDAYSQVNQRDAPFSFYRSPEGMRHMLWNDEIQAVTFHAPDEAKVLQMVEEAMND